MLNKFILLTVSLYFIPDFFVSKSLAEEIKINTVKHHCDADYNLTSHYKTGKVDICSIKIFIEPFTILTNWGTKPEWINNHQFVFLSNQIGDVYLMDMIKNKVINLTESFAHAGFTRAHKLPGGHLLLVGPESGPIPPKDPLTIYDTGQFTGNIWVFEAPFDKAPYLLMLEDEDGKRQKVNAWEGLALSKESNKMVWSDTQTPFFGSNLIASGWNYLTAPSRLWVGDFIYQRQNSIIKNAREIVSKYDIGLIFLEPQNFLGENDEKVTFSAYGPTSNGAANTYLYNFKKQVIEHIRIGEGYQEWEGASPDYQRSFVEVQQDASRFIGPTNVELYLYDFNNEDLSRFSFFRGNEKNIHDLYLHEPVFSPDGKNVLVTIGGGDGWEINSPGYGLGILIINIDDLLLIYTKE